MSEAEPSEIMIKVEHLEKHYQVEKVTIPVLKGVDFEVRRGSWIALLGTSGSGKTTLLNLLGTLEHPDAGEISFENRPYSHMDRGSQEVFRRDRIGFIFQAYHMLPELTIWENVQLPGMFQGQNRKELQQRAKELLVKVGLSHRLKHRAGELSGGEQQRAAIARALINSPALLLADEPTGNLDSQTGGEILSIFQQLHASARPVTIIMVTHDRNIATLADRVIELRDGKIEA
ncbi:MAG: ABC transporter ATP-binding protein [Victivallales bacterium]|nr:ABC transporter ATP-binding protein [Victivallales bacterium]